MIEIKEPPIIDISNCVLVGPGVAQNLTKADNVVVIGRNIDAVVNGKRYDKDAVFLGNEQFMIACTPEGWFIDGRHVELEDPGEPERIVECFRSWIKGMTE